MPGRLAPGPGSRRAVAGYDPAVELPKRQIPHPGRGKAWDRRTRQAWVALTTRWCHLQQVFWEALDRGESPSALKSLNAELRAMEASLFASPAARQANRVQPKRSASRALSTSGSVSFRDLGID